MIFLASFSTIPNTTSWATNKSIFSTIRTEFHRSIWQNHRVVEKERSQIEFFFGHRINTDEALNLHPIVFSSGAVSAHVNTEKIEKLFQIRKSVKKYLRFYLDWWLAGNPLTPPASLGMAWLKAASANFRFLTPSSVSVLPLVLWNSSNLSAKSAPFSNCRRDSNLCAALSSCVKAWLTSMKKGGRLVMFSTASWASFRVGKVTKAVLNGEATFRP